MDCIDNELTILDYVIIAFKIDSAFNMIGNVEGVREKLLGKANKYVLYNTHFVKHTNCY